MRPAPDANHCEPLLYVPKSEKQRLMKRISFTMDRAQRGTLAEKMADGLRRAIKSGVYRKGDRLPAVRDLVAHFGVSSRVPVAAFKILAREGLVEAMPNRGCTVREFRSPVWKGHVCIVTAADFSFSTAMTVSRIRSMLSAAGYMFTEVVVQRLEGGRLDMGILDYVLEQPVDFAVVLDRSRRLAARIEKAGVPFVSEAKKGVSFKMCRGTYAYELEKAYRQFAAQCRKRKDKRVVCVVKRSGESESLLSALNKAGVAAEEWCLYPKRQGSGRLEILKRTAFNAFEARLIDGKERLPDAFCFSDDYLATGAMAALCAYGVRFPQDVRIATVANIGNAPVFAGGFDRFEFDLEKCGEMIAEAVLSGLSGKKVPGRLKFLVDFVAL
jgi:DNA-binding LacI/PurR family transcriptional regulator